MKVLTVDVGIFYFPSHFKMYQYSQSKVCKTAI